MFIFFFLMSFALGFMNPYLGFFAFFVLIQALIVFCFFSNGIQRAELASFAFSIGKEKEAQFYKKNGRRMLNTTVFITVVLNFVYAFICSAVWLMTVVVQEGNTICLPEDILGIQGHIEVCFVLLIMSFALNVVSTFFVIAARKRVLTLEMKKQESFLPVKEIKFKVSRRSKAAILLAMLLCLLSDKLSWIGLLINFFFFLFIMILHVQIKTWLRFKDAGNYASIQAQYALSGIEVGGKMYRMCIFLCWFVAAIIVVTQLLLLTQNISWLHGMIGGSFGKTIAFCAMAVEVLSAYFLREDIKNIEIIRKAA